VAKSAPEVEVSRSVHVGCIGVLIGLAAIVIFVGFRSCSGDGDSNNREASEQAVARTKETEAAEARSIARLRSYLRDNFSETTWYPAIERIELAPFLTVHTTLYREYEPAQAICNAVRFSGEFPGVPVRVFNRDGDRIMWTGDPGDQQPCDDD
jgi:hypothetical protein